MAANRAEKINAVFVPFFPLCRSLVFIFFTGAYYITFQTFKTDTQLRAVSFFSVDIPLQ